MSRRNRQKANRQDKVVFVLDANSQDRNTPKLEDTYSYVSNMLDVLLRKNQVGTNTIFIGGSKHDICMWVSGILEFYQYKEIDIHNNTFLYRNDPDFDMLKKFQ